MVHQVNFAPAFKALPYWWDAAEPKPERRAELPAKVDQVVVGGGYTGLSCALEIARGGGSVAVVETERIGFGASSRNGGMVSGGLKLVQGGVAAELGEERASAILKE